MEVRSSCLHGPEFFYNIETSANRVQAKQANFRANEKPPALRVTVSVIIIMIFIVIVTA